MPLATSLSAAKCISVSPVPARTAAICRIERAAAEDDDAAGGLLHQRGEQCRAFDRGIALAAGQHAADAGADQRFQRLVRVARHVEGAVAGDRDRPCRLHQRAHPGLVDVAVGGQAADHHAGHAEVAHARDVLDHRGEFDSE